MRRSALILGIGAALLLGGCVTTGTGQQAVSAGCDTSFRLVNVSGVTVREVYFSHSSRNGWGPDQLGDRVLPSGQTMNFRAANVGSYDFRVVLANGRASELRQVNICRASTISIASNGLRAT